MSKFWGIWYEKASLWRSYIKEGNHFELYWPKRLFEVFIEKILPSSLEARNLCGLLLKKKSSSLNVLIPKNSMKVFTVNIWRRFPIEEKYLFLDIFRKNSSIESIIFIYKTDWRRVVSKRRTFNRRSHWSHLYKRPSCKFSSEEALLR